MTSNPLHAASLNPCPEIVIQCEQIMGLAKQKRLTYKEQAFVRNVVNGKSLTRSALADLVVIRLRITRLQRMGGGHGGFVRLLRSKA
jgi:hypothetical protein